MKMKDDMLKKLNLSPLLLTNKTACTGTMGFPSLSCKVQTMPDYIALYAQPSDYHRTEMTCVAFYNYDIAFDGKDGIYQAILYDDQKRQEELRKRFSGVKFFIAPDYSVCGDCQPYRNYYQMGRAREVAIWLTMYCDGIVFPNISCARAEDLPIALEGYEEVTAVAFSTKGKLDYPDDRKLLEETVRYTVEHMPQLKNILVYDVSYDNSDAKEIFLPATERGIAVHIPNNQLKMRNRINHIKRNKDS